MTVANSMIGSLATVDGNISCWTNISSVHHNNALSNSTPSLKIYQQTIHGSAMPSLKNVPKPLFIEMYRKAGVDFTNDSNSTMSCSPTLQPMNSDTLKTSNFFSDITIESCLTEDERNSSIANLPQIHGSPSSTNFAQQQQQQKNPKLYKTELCRSWADTGKCNYGDRCQYAHGDNEKRPIPRHPKYKTEACQSYHKTGYCPYGPRCHFIHNEEPHVIAGLVAANNAAKSASGGGSTASTGASPASTTASSSSAPNQIRSVNSINTTFASPTELGTAPGTPHRARMIGTSPLLNSSKFNGNVTSLQSPPLPAKTSGYHNDVFNQRNLHFDVNNQHHPLTVTQSTERMVPENNNFFSSQHLKNNNSHDINSTTATAFFIKNPHNQIHARQSQFYPQQQLEQSQRQKQINHANQQLPLTSVYKQGHTSPYSKQNLFSFHQPSGQDQQLEDRMSEFTLCYEENVNELVNKSLNGGDSSPSSSLGSADSGTESAELESGSADSGSRFSPSLEVDEIITGSEMLNEHFTRLSPTSFRRHNLILIDEEIPRLSFSSSSTILDHGKDKGRISEGSTVIAVDDFLTSPTNSLFDITPNNSKAKINLFGNRNQKLSILADNFSTNLTLANKLPNVEGRNSCKTISATDDSSKAFTRSSPSSISLLQNLQNLVSERNVNSNNFLLSGESLKNWSTAELAPALHADCQSTTTELVKKSNAMESLRRASGSSLGSVGAPGVNTPTSSSTASASISSDELWTSAPGSITDTNAQFSASGIRLPVFERLSNGPL